MGHHVSSKILVQAHLSLDLISDEQYMSLPVEELITLRKIELKMAKLKDAARIAARRYDWGPINRLVEN